MNNVTFSVRDVNFRLKHEMFQFLLIIRMVMSPGVKINNNQTPEIKRITKSEVVYGAY